MKKNEENNNATLFLNIQKRNEFLQKNKLLLMYKKLVKNKLQKIILYILIIFIYNYLFPRIIEFPKLRQLNQNYSEICMTYNITGNQFVIHNVEFPDAIYANGDEVTLSVELTEANSIKYTFISEITIIRIIWYNKQLTTCENMFHWIDYITKIDLSQFDSSKVVTTSGMFYKCTGLTEINLSNFDTSSVTNMAHMFLACESLTSIDVSSFNTSKVENMLNLFGYDKELLSVDLSNFDTSKVTNMNYMFYECSKITSINFSNYNTKSVLTYNAMFKNCRCLISVDISSFNTSKANDINAMFYGCTNLEKIVQNFDTSNVSNLNYMFYGCSKLTSLNLSNFNMTNVKLMQSMFEDCESLENIEFNNSITINEITNIKSLFSGCKNLNSLDLSFMDISHITNMDFMFYNSENLKYLNISSFDTSSINSMISTFDGCISLNYINIGSFIENDTLNLTNIFNDISENLIICIKNISKAENIILLMREKNINNDCSDLCMSENSIYTVNNNSCSGYCSNNGLYKYKYNNKCLINCNNYYISYNQRECQNEIPDGYYQNSSLLKTLDKCPDKCSICSYESMKNNSCISCNSKYYKLFSGNFVDCFIECPEGYINVGNVCEIYTEMKTEITKEEIIKTTEITQETESKIREATSEKIIEKSTEILINKLTDIYTNNYCDDKLYILVETDLCIEKCSSINFLTKICKAINNSLAVKEDIINNIRQDIMNGNLKNLLDNITHNIDIDIFDFDIIYQLTSTFNQENNQYENISVIKLLDCEKRLKSFYNISNNMSLIIFKVDLHQEGLLMPIVEYDVYHPLTYKKLDLEICSNISIEINIPVSINENELFKYDPKSDFYNDKCYPYTSNHGTDVTLIDRQNEYIDNNLTLCENNCKYIGYDTNTKYASCSCDTKLYINISNYILIDNNRLLNGFKNIKYMINLEVMKCYSKLFQKDGIIKNIGSYILLFSIFFFIISLIIFINKGFKSLLTQINILVQTNKMIKQNNINNIKKQLQTEPNKIKKLKKRRNVKRKANKKEGFLTDGDNLATKNKLIKKPLKISNFPPKKKNNILIHNNKSSNNISKTNEIFNTTIKRFKHKLIRKKLKNESDKKVNIKINSQNNDLKNEECNKNKINPYFTDNEMNSLIYNEALKYDKRTYFKYYLSLIRTKHMFFFAFFPNIDYNSQIIKISLFVFSFNLYYTINGLFFTYNTMHEIYKNSGKFDFIYQLPQILYSTIISVFINALIKYFSLSEKNILKIKNEQNIKENVNIIPKTIKCLKIKFLIFYLLSFIFLLFFWFYLSCFCAVYKNSQIYLIEDTLISFGLSLFYPIVLNLLPGIFRIPSLINEKKDKKSLYDLSKIIQMI